MEPQHLVLNIVASVVSLGRWIRLNEPNNQVLFFHADHMHFRKYCSAVGGGRGLPPTHHSPRAIEKLFSMVQHLTEQRWIRTDSGLGQHREEKAFCSKAIDMLIL
jgi:hypothetical protein